MIMLSSKGQSNIIGAVLIMVIAIGMLSVAYSFGLPLIQKNQDRAIEERANVFFDLTNMNSLPAKVKFVANNGGREIATLKVDGRMEVNETENSIKFDFQSRVSSYATGAGFIPLTGDACPPSDGILGLEEPAVVCVKSEKIAGEFYHITYKMFLRELKDAQERNGFNINLVKHPSSPVALSGETTIRIEFDRRRSETVNQKNLINTDVKILLV